MQTDCPCGGFEGQEQGKGSASGGADCVSKESLCFLRAGQGRLTEWNLVLGAANVEQCSHPHRPASGKWGHLGRPHPGGSCYYTMARYSQYQWEAALPQPGPSLSVLGQDARLALPSGSASLLATPRPPFPTQRPFQQASLFTNNVFKEKLVRGEDLHCWNVGVHFDMSQCSR